MPYLVPKKSIHGLKMQQLWDNCTAMELSQMRFLRSSDPGIQTRQPHEVTPYDYYVSKKNHISILLSKHEQLMPLEYEQDNLMK